ncbi:MAG TPA: tRNA isopentenyl-2-thiomethyl-A-37 hydroxylase MiaE, partial [Polyangiaceae bacterium]
MASRNLDAVLSDHAHCEMKAATTALSLALKNHEHLDAVIVLTKLAQEEIDHFNRVVTFLKQRGQPLGLPPVDEYAVELHKALKQLLRTGAQPSVKAHPVVDRLLLGAIIEARSCERFKLLLDAWPSNADSELRVFYSDLFECEARHYVQYRELAVRVSGQPEQVIASRLKTLAELEG